MCTNIHNISCLRKISNISCLHFLGNMLLLAEKQLFTFVDIIFHHLMLNSESGRQMKKHSSKIDVLRFVVLDEIKT